MTVTLDLNPEVEQGLLALARERGVSLDAYLQDLVSQQVRLEAPTAPAKAKTLNLPAWHLGDMGPMRRCDIYDEALEDEAS